MNPLISVIVPVYNTEQFLEKCVKSLLSQTYDNIEIILVDDGSVDGSADLCDRLKAVDKRIVVIHQANAGVSAARNHGLAEMKGSYVTFVDSDDYVAPDYIQVMYDALSQNDADISTCGMYRVDSARNNKLKIAFADINSRTKCVSGASSIRNMFYDRLCSASSCSKLYDKELFDSLKFPPLIMGEDTFLAYSLLLKANMVAHTRKPLYYYVKHPASVTNSKENYIKFYDYIKLYDYIMSENKYKDDKEFFLSLTNRLVENNFWVYMKLRNCPDMYEDEKKHIVDNIKKYRKYVITNPKAKFRVRGACFLSYGGMNFLNKIYDNINKKQ